MELTRLQNELPRLLDHMRAVGYSDPYVRQVELFVERLVEAAPGLRDWDDVARWVKSLSAGWKRGSHSPKLAIARQYEEDNVLPRTPEARRYARTGARDRIGADFSRVLEAYEASSSAAAKSARTVRGETSQAACFFLRFEEMGRSCPSEVTEDDVIGVLTDDDGKPAYTTATVRALRTVLRGAGDAVDGCSRLASLVPVPRAWQLPGETLTESESRAVAEAIADEGNGISLRDRAIVSLLLHTGMRACDVAALRVGAVDWRREELEFTQSKTGVTVRLPLTPALGNAIFDYLTGERARGGDDHLFLSLQYPHGGLRAGSIHNVVNAVFDVAGVRCGEGDARGTHMFRRAAATAMVEAGADRAVVASVLGQTSARTTDRYVTAAVEGLRRHASLDVSRFPYGEGVTER